MWAGRGPRASGAVVLKGHKVATQPGRTPTFSLISPSPALQRGPGGGRGPVPLPWGLDGLQASAQPQLLPPTSDVQVV